MKADLLRQYNEAKAAVADLPVWAMIEDFKRKHAAYQTGAAPSFEEEKAVSALYWELMLSLPARRFIETERALVEDLAREMLEDAEGCDMDFGFLPAGGRE